MDAAPPLHRYNVHRGLNAAVEDQLSMTADVLFKVRVGNSGRWVEAGSLCVAVQGGWVGAVHLIEVIGVPTLGQLVQIRVCEDM